MAFAASKRLLRRAVFVKLFLTALLFGIVLVILWYVLHVGVRNYACRVFWSRVGPSFRRTTSLHKLAKCTSNPLHTPAPYLTEGLLHSRGSTICEGEKSTANLDNNPSLTQGSCRGTLCKLFGFATSVRVEVLCLESADMEYEMVDRIQYIESGPLEFVEAGERHVLPNCPNNSGLNPTLWRTEILTMEALRHSATPRDRVTD